MILYFFLSSSVNSKNLIVLFFFFHRLREFSPTKVTIPSCLPNLYLQILNGIFFPGILDTLISFMLGQSTIAKLKAESKLGNIIFSKLVFLKQFRIFCGLSNIYTFNSPNISISFNFVHPEKASSDIFFMFSGNTIFSKLVQFLNALSPINSKFPKTSFFSFLVSEKQSFPMHL